MALFSLSKRWTCRNGKRGVTRQVKNLLPHLAPYGVEVNFPVHLRRGNPLSLHNQVNSQREARNCLCSRASILEIVLLSDTLLLFASVHTEAPRHSQSVLANAVYLPNRDTLTGSSRESTEPAGVIDQAMVHCSAQTGSTGS